VVDVNPTKVSLTAMILDYSVCPQRHTVAKLCNYR